MPPLSELPGDLARKRLLRALVRIGFQLDMSGGNGSHVMVNWPATNKSVTIAYQMLPKKVLKYIVEQIEVVSLGQVDWDRIKDEL